MNINSIAVFFSAVAAIAALGVAGVSYLQLKYSRFALGADIILKLEARFDTIEMRAARNRAADALKNSLDTKDLEDVLDFFETLGVLVRRHAVDDELAWHSFSYWVLRYDALAGDQIHARRKATDETYYEEFDLLAEKMKQIDIKKRRLKARPFFPRESLESFIEEELVA